jgi:8-oxo-dGTP pyrophosphatase MutT (NUDIX family)
MNKSRTDINAILDHIEPMDDLEMATIERVRGWLAEGRPLFRKRKPDVPPEHLVSYCVVIDRARESILLMCHRRAGLWLPTGGHAEMDEDLHAAAGRELAEELGPRAAMVATVADMPLFITATRTRGAGSHTDISLWYVVAGDERMWLEPDPAEFSAHRWVPWQRVLELDPADIDPEMPRFMTKLMARITT